jgi:hypothetical protein
VTTFFPRRLGCRCFTGARSEGAGSKSFQHLPNLAKTIAFQGAYHAK